MCRHLAALLCGVLESPTSDEDLAAQVGGRVYVAPSLTHYVARGATRCVAHNAVVTQRLTHYMTYGAT